MAEQPAKEKKEKKVEFLLKDKYREGKQIIEFHANGRRIKRTADWLKANPVKAICEYGLEAHFNNTPEEFNALLDAYAKAKNGGKLPASYERRKLSLPKDHIDPESITITI